MASHITPSPFDPWAMLNQHQQQSALSTQFGATATFVGTMRDINQDTLVTQMTLEHYPEMTALYLDKLEQQAKQHWPLLDCLIIHRVGIIQPTDAIVLIACWSAHRRAALDACNWLIEELKFNAPFWKKETYQEGERWVEHNTNGN